MKRQVMSKTAVTLGLAAGLTLAGMPAAYAQAPPNDDFDDAIAIGALPFDDTRDTTTATTEPDDPDCFGNGHTVWYSFTPSATIEVVADTFGSSYDTALSAYTGSRGNLTQVACNDDFRSLQSRIRLTGTGGVTYFLMVGSFGASAGGNLSFHMRELSAQPPPNDDFDDAIAIGALPFDDTRDTTDATTAPDDPECAGNGHTVWYSFTPSATIEVAADTSGSDYGTTLSAYTGSRGNLTQVACNVDFSPVSRITLTVTGGVTYFLMVGSFFDSPGGVLSFHIRELPPRVILGLTIDPTGVVNNRTGVARIHLAVTCSRPAADVDVIGSLRQRVGGKVAVGFFERTVDCSRRVSWRASVVGETGPYKIGRAEARATASFFDPDRGKQVTGMVQTVRLRAG